MMTRNARGPSQMASLAGYCGCR